MTETYHGFTPYSFTEGSRADGKVIGKENEKVVKAGNKVSAQQGLLPERKMNIGTFWDIY